MIHNYYTENSLINEVPHTTVSTCVSPMIINYEHIQRIANKAVQANDFCNGI